LQRDKNDSQRQPRAKQMLAEDKAVDGNVISRQCGQKPKNPSVKGKIYKPLSESLSELDMRFHIEPVYQVVFGERGILPITEDKEARDYRKKECNRVGKKTGMEKKVLFHLETSVIFTMLNLWSFCQDANDKHRIVRQDDRNSISGYIWEVKKLVLS
jgi:hypothetical protein